jgi:hypothetical protein
MTVSTIYLILIFLSAIILGLFTSERDEVPKIVERIRHVCYRPDDAKH